MTRVGTRGANANPIERLRRHLDATGLLSTDLVKSLSADAEQLAADLRSGCRSLPEPSTGSSFQNTYAEIADDLARQSYDFAAFVASLDEAEQPA